MSAPVRWKEDGSEASSELRALMQHARAQTPDAVQIEAMTTNVLAQLPAPAPVVDALATTGGASVGAKLLLVVAALSALGASVWWSLPRQKPEAHAPRATPARVDAAQPPTPAASNTAETAPEPEPAAQPAASRPAHGKLTRASRAQPTPVASASTSELELLHAARSTHRRAPRQALEMLRRHERDYPQSAFGEEREALTIELLLYFDPVQAAQRLSAFERDYPSSPYRARLQRGP